MDSERYEIGLKVRAEVLGEEYVNKAVQGRDRLQSRVPEPRHRVLLGRDLGQSPSRPQAAQHPESRVHRPRQHGQADGDEPREVGARHRRPRRGAEPVNDFETLAIAIY